jgi:voltage-gated potassium channel
MDETVDEPADNVTDAVDDPDASHAYDLFILVLTVFSLVIMVAMLLPFGDSTIGLLQFYDNLICVIFLIDFAMRMRAAHPKRSYFIDERGWLDLLGSIPSFGVAFKYTGLLRLARLSRLARVSRLMRGKQRADLAKDVLENRSRYALFITVLTTLIVLCTASALVLRFESQSPEANVTTGWNAFWYSIVTITTVGYGDYYPVTVGGRIAGMFIMVAGLGIIGALASILASLLVGGGSSEPSPPPETAPEPDSELAEIRSELAALRSMMERIESRSSPP